MNVAFRRPIFIQTARAGVKRCRWFSVNKPRLQSSPGQSVAVSEKRSATIATSPSNIKSQDWRSLLNFEHVLSSEKQVDAERLSSFLRDVFENRQRLLSDRHRQKEFSTSLSRILSVWACGNDVDSLLIAEIVGNVGRLAEAKCIVRLDKRVAEDVWKISQAAMHDLPANWIRIIAWANCVLITRPKRCFWESLESRATQIMDSFSVGDLATVLWAMSKSRYRPTNYFMDSVQDRATAKLRAGRGEVCREYTSQQVSNLLFSIARMGFIPSQELFAEIKAVIQEGHTTLNPIDCANVAWALTKIYHALPSSDVMETVEFQTLSVLSSFQKPTELSTALSSLVKLGGFSDPEAHNKVESVVFNMVQANVLDTRSLVEMVWAFGKAGASISSLTAVTLQENFVHMCSGFNARDVSTFLWGLWKMDIRPTKTFWECASKVSKSTLRQCDLQTLIMLSVSISKLDLPVDCDLGTEIVQACADGTWSELWELERSLETLLIAMPTFHASPSSLQGFLSALEEERKLSYGNEFGMASLNVRSLLALLECVSLVPPGAWPQNGLVHALENELASWAPRLNGRNRSRCFQILATLSPQDFQLLRSSF